MRSVTPNQPRPGDDAKAVDALLAGMGRSDDPLVSKVRAEIVGADRRISEGVKWNSPSFHLNGWFATLNLRQKSGVMVVMHRGAKASRTPPKPDDPSGLLVWRGDDRATVTFANLSEFKSRRTAFNALVAAWAASQVD